MSVQELDDWQERAACRGPQAEVFYPPLTSERRDQRIARERSAKAICGTCASREPCLEYALKIKEPHGIWGGLNESERRQLLIVREELAAQGDEVGVPVQVKVSSR